MPKVSEEHLDARRQQVLTAAMVCFARDGVHPATIQDICAEAGMSPGAVYSYFKSKQGIIEALAAFGLDLSEQLIRQARRERDPLEALRLIAADFLGLFDRHHPFYRQFEGRIGPAEIHRLNITLRAEALRNPQMLAIYRGNYQVLYGLIADAIRAAQQQELIRADLDPVAVTQVMFSFFIGLENQQSYHETLDVAAYVEVVQRMLSGEIRTPGNGNGNGKDARRTVKDGGS